MSDFDDKYVTFDSMDDFYRSLGIELIDQLECVLDGYGFTENKPRFWIDDDLALFGKSNVCGQTMLMSNVKNEFWGFEEILEKTESGYRTTWIEWSGRDENNNDFFDTKFHGLDMPGIVGSCYDTALDMVFDYGNEDLEKVCGVPLEAP